MSLRNAVRSVVDKAVMLYVSRLTREEYRSQQFLAVNERPVELQMVFKYLARACPRTVLDVGTGATALPHLMRHCGCLVTAIDNIHDFWPRGMVNRHYHVIHDDITHPRLSQTFDFITCISVLEHITDHGSAMRSMLSLLNPGGYLLVSFPYNESRYVPNVYDLPESDVREKPRYITQAFSRSEVAGWLGDGVAQLREQEYWRFYTGDYWTCGERICPPVAVTQSEKHQISCLVIQKKRSKSPVSDG